MMGMIEVPTQVIQVDRGTTHQSSNKQHIISNGTGIGNVSVRERRKE